MKLISRTEEMLLLAVYALQENAYGLAIRRYLRDLTGKKYSVGAIYVPLDRLESRGLLAASEGLPTAERGGRAKRFFRLTLKGEEALEAVQKLNLVLWKDYPISQTSTFKAVLPI